MLGLGFDSGGTHTTVTGFAGGADCPLQGPCECPHSISRSRGTAAGEKAAQWIVNFIQQQPDDHIVAWIGAAGYCGAWSDDVTALFEPYLDQLRTANRNINLFIANDAVSLLKAPPLNQSGIVAVVGTGSVVMGSHPQVLRRRIIKRGGAEWVASDQGSGTWMTIQAVKLLLQDIHLNGLNPEAPYQSVLLDSLSSYFNVPQALINMLPKQYRAQARIEHIASTLANPSLADKKRIAGFAFPHLFKLGTPINPAKPASPANPAPDPIAAQVIACSAIIIAQQIESIATTITSALPTPSPPTLPMPLGSPSPPSPPPKLNAIAVGSIANNPHYASLLNTALANHPLINSLQTVPNATRHFAQLAYLCAALTPLKRFPLTRSFDPLHSITQLL